MSIPTMILMRVAAAAGTAIVATGVLVRRCWAHARLVNSLGVFVLDRLDDDDRARVQDHVDACAKCQAEVIELAPVVEWLRQTTIDLRDDPTTPIPAPRLEWQATSPDKSG